MGTEALKVKNETKSDQNDYNSSDLLSQWLNSLETRSSLFWLHYVECNFRSREHSGSREHSEVGRSNSVETPDSSFDNSSSSEFTEDSSLENTNSLPDQDTFSGNYGFIITLHEHFVLYIIAKYC